MTNNLKEAISCLEKATHIFLDIGRLNEIAKLYEHENNFELAIVYYLKSNDLFQNMDLISSANYSTSIAIFDEIAIYSIRINLLNYGFKGHLRNAGIFQLCTDTGYNIFRDARVQVSNGMPYSLY
ncbi:hypothetical protein H5410_059753 [Solanum commersonii]|uniref:Uncharacterized protein n=1 Tax=Solanum commersonii TaxID=4109 RepID=A0A9J5W382_SOLCO|nr:hypothetical protein H5410_059753 [Solanum commersonii]